MVVVLASLTPRACEYFSIKAPVGSSEGHLTGSAKKTCTNYGLVYLVYNDTWVEQDMIQT